MKKIQWKEGLSDEELSKYTLNTLRLIEQNQSDRMRKIVAEKNKKISQRKKVSKALTGKKLSQSTKEKIGNANRNPSATTLEKMSKASKGRKHSKRQKEIIREKMKNRIFTEEHRKRISEAQKKRWKTRSREISEETRKKISEAGKKRWARQRKNNL